MSKIQEKKKTQAFGNLFIRLGNFDTTCESDMNTTWIYRVWVKAITRLW